MIIPVILAGGVGIRLWPLSKKKHPKQFLQLINHKTLFQMTLNRLNQFENSTPPIVIGNHLHRYILAEQVRQVDLKTTFLLEEKMRNTAASVILSALYAMKSEKDDPILFFTPADQYISDDSVFRKQIQRALLAAMDEKIVLFGVKPNSPNTQYGYIECGESLKNDLCYRVNAFKEKPDIETAKNFIKSGNYYWNSGMFLCKASVLINELSIHASSLLSAGMEIVDNLFHDKKNMSSEFIVFNSAMMEQFPSISIDNALLEKTKKTVVFNFEPEWEDIGSWQSYYRISKKDENDNVIHGNVVTFNSYDCFFHSEKQLLVSSGVEKCMVIATNDVIYVAPLDKTQDIKKIIKKLVDKKYDEDGFF